MKILVVGGAGYIGSHMVKLLNDHHYEIVVLDSLEHGHRDAVVAGQLIVGDLADQELLKNIFSQHTFSAVMHFASYIQVGESVIQPFKYYQNNFVNTLNLLNVMQQYDVKNFVFSSTAAVYGEPQYIPIDEKHRLKPINPYGYSKFMVEQVLKDYEKAYGLRSVCLRYFNAAGADPSGLLGERHNPETHLIPLILQAAAGLRPNISIFGNDYDTPDGTCIRDYIHVVDLCEAHRLVLEQLIQGMESKVYNVGTGKGYSVQEVITAVEQVTGKSIITNSMPRRAGDPAQLVADPALLKKEQGWTHPASGLHNIIQDAWNWMQKPSSTYS